MKTIKFFLLLITFFLTFQNSKSFKSLNITNKNIKITCTVDKIKSNPQKYELSEEQKKQINNRRKLDDEEFQPIRIYLSTGNILNQASAFVSSEEDQKLLDDIIQYFYNTIEYTTKLIRVKPIYYVIIYNDNNDLELQRGVSSDLVIIPGFSFFRFIY